MKKILIIAIVLITALACGLCSVHDIDSVDFSSAHYSVDHQEAAPLISSAIIPEMEYSEYRSTKSCFIEIILTMKSFRPPCIPA